MSPTLFFRLASLLWYVYMLGVAVLLALWVRHRWFPPVGAPAAIAPVATPGVDALAMVVLGALLANGLFARWLLRRLQGRFERLAAGAGSTTARRP